MEARHIIHSENPHRFSDASTTYQLWRNSRDVPVTYGPHLHLTPRHGDRANPGVTRYHCVFGLQLWLTEKRQPMCLCMCTSSQDRRNEIQIFVRSFLFKAKSTRDVVGLFFFFFFRTLAVNSVSDFFFFPQSKIVTHIGSTLVRRNIQVLTLDK